MRLSFGAIAVAVGLAACAATTTGTSISAAAAGTTSSSSTASTSGGTTGTGGSGTSGTGVGAGGSSGTGGNTDAGVPIIDELGYFAALQTLRPDLAALDVSLADAGPLVESATCYDTLVLRAELRAQVLDAGASYATLESSTYSSGDQTADLAWMATQQEAEVAFCASSSVGGCYEVCAATCAACAGESFAQTTQPLPPYYPSGYSLCAFVGYQEGPFQSIYDANGLAWKVFFEIADVDDELTVAQYQLFSAALADAGFQGDSKILTDPELPWQARLQYNDVIVHGHSLGDAEIAEQVGLSVFAGQLAARARGLDIGTPPHETDALDWHHYLCIHQGDLSAIPQQALDFVHFQN